MSDFSAKELIGRKRDGGALTAAEIGWVIAEYTAERLPDYQMAALLMAVLWRGLGAEELSAWTTAMLQSGETLDFSDLPQPKVDKHSTGGVGDKVSIPLAPMVAACGVAVPMVSGRGLGHTGGTLDKLESIPGFRTQLDPGEFGAVLRRRGLVMAGQSASLAPADRRIYALRDVTGTVPSVDLISSSIMSKKLAEGLDALVLDVKVGRGAFMQTLDEARVLAETMVGIGRSHRTEVIAILTAMDQPLGREVGNASEMRESLAMLRGDAPGDLAAVVLRLGEEMLVLGGIAADAADARGRLQDSIASGAAADVFRGVIADQGGDPAVVDDPGILPTASRRTTLPSPVDGYVTVCDALAIGRAAVRLGAGRARQDEAIDPAVGITLLAKIGDAVEEGQPLAEIAWNDEARLAAARPLLEAAWEISPAPVEPLPPLILDEIR